MTGSSGGRTGTGTGSGDGVAQLQRARRGMWLGPSDTPGSSYRVDGCRINGFGDGWVCVRGARSPIGRIISLTELVRMRRLKVGRPFASPHTAPKNQPVVLGRVLVSVSDKPATTAQQSPNVTASTCSRTMLEEQWLTHTAGT